MKNNKTLIKMIVVVLFLLINSSFVFAVDFEVMGNEQYLLGVGIADITGPVADVGMMGYADINQETAGIHIRQYARTFIIKDPLTNNSVVYIGTDLGMCFQSIKTNVILKLKEVGLDNLYNDKNIMINATHTHSCPGGYSYYGLYNLSTLGHVKENLMCIVDGIVESIVNAHSNLELGYIEFNRGKVFGITKNRSIDAYNNNPSNEINNYEYDVDKNMYVLNFRNKNSELIGVLNWFAIHPTSMTSDNKLISGDNKGVSSYMFEKNRGTDYSKKKTFVCSFSQSNCGDVSPKYDESSCMTKLDDNGMQRTIEIAKKQYSACKKISQQASKRVVGDIEFRHIYMDFSDIEIEGKYTGEGKKSTYPGCMGYSFAPGAEDNRTDLPFFYEGMTQPKYSYNSSANNIKKLQNVLNFAPKLNQINGARYPKLWSQHYPKPVLFATCKAQPDAWTPQIVPLQIIKIGNIVIVGVPAEVTTMSARRLKVALQNKFKVMMNEKCEVIISGNTNSYTSYLATPQEYDLQHYEGASTQFGKWTLSAYIQEFEKLVESMAKNIEIDNGLRPPDLSNKQSYFKLPVIFDGIPSQCQFGQVYMDAKNEYKKKDMVKVVFWSGHPNNSIEQRKSFLEIEYKQNGKWVTIAHDWDLETRYMWERYSSILGTSQSTVIWEIPDDTPSGTYRIRHNGAYKSIDGKIKEYHGYSREFLVLPN